MEQRVLGERYRLEELIGSGGMSTVWRAHDEVLGRPVAVKLLSGRYSLSEVYRQRIREEACAAAALSHPNVAQVYDFGESVEDDGPVPYVVMELVAGRTLEQRMTAGAVRPKVAFRICAEVAAALAAAHADGLVHRDIKPANVMVTATGAKVVDFGIAVARDASAVDEPLDELVGTPAYMAPERITDDAVQPASDVYSLGVLLYKLLAGRSPWHASTPAELLAAHVCIDPAPLPALPGVPEDVRKLCRSCLDKDPAARPTARRLATALAEAAGIRTVHDDVAYATAPSGADGEPSTVLVRGQRRADATPRRRRVKVAIAAASVVVAGLLVGLLVPLGRTTQHDPSAQAAVPGATGPVPSSGAPASTGTTVTGAAPPAPGVTGAGSGPAASGPAADRGATTGPPSPAPQPSTSTGGAPVLRTLSSVGGTVRATCTDTGAAQLVSSTPAKGYKIVKLISGPAPVTSVTFQHGLGLVLMTVTCTNGQPTAIIG